MNQFMLIASKDSEDYITCPGSRYRDDYVGKLDKETGVIILVPIGKTDVFEYIQSFKDETDINTLIQRAQNGDVSAFSSAVFGDFTEMPETFADALNIVIEAEREFNALPTDIKRRFNNDFHQYVATAGSREWLEKFEMIDKAGEDQQPTPTPIKESDTENEQKQ